MIRLIMFSCLYQGYIIHEDHRLQGQGSEAYKTTFQLDPDIHIPNKFPIPYHPLNNTCVVSSPTLFNAPFSNCGADHLVLNPTQFASLCHLIGNVANVYTLTYLISTELPLPSSNQDTTKVVFLLGFYQMMPGTLYVTTGLW